MTGNYPDMPGKRLGWDRDGTRLFLVTGTGPTITEQVDAVKQSLNRESSELTGVNLAYAVGATNRLVWLFPDPTTLDVLWVDGNGTVAFDVLGSTNTTNGIDGTWTTLLSNISRSSVAVALNYRIGASPDAFVAVGAANLRGLAVVPRSTGWSASAIGKVHLFGQRSTGNRLVFWDAVSDVAAGANLLEWGDKPRGASETRSFRIKNLSPSLTANSPRVAMEVLTDAAPSLPGQHQISKDGGATWGAQQTLAALSPGAISAEVLQIRQSLLTSAQLSLWAFRCFAEAGSWS